MSRLHHQQGAEPSQRMLRVGELIRHTMSDLLDPFGDQRSRSSKARS